MFLLCEGQAGAQGARQERKGPGRRADGRAYAAFWRRGAYVGKRRGGLAITQRRRAEDDVLSPEGVLAGLAALEGQAARRPREGERVTSGQQEGGRRARRREEGEVPGGGRGWW